MSGLDRYKFKLPSLDPSPRTYAEDNENRRLNGGDEASAAEGYRVLTRADPKSIYPLDRQTIADGPVYDFDNPEG